MNLKNPTNARSLRLYTRTAIYLDVEFEKQAAIYDAMNAKTPAAKRRTINKLNAIYYWERSHH